jgi:hypothetical protein
MKRFLTGANRAVGPDGLGGMWKWLIAGVMTFGVAPVSVRGQDMMGSMRIGRVSRPRPPVAEASTYTNPYATNPYTTPDAMNPYTMRSDMVSPYNSGTSYVYANSYAPVSSPMSPGTSGAAAGYGGRGYGGRGYGQAGTGQTAPFVAATLFGLPTEGGRMQWPVGLRILSPANETKALREQLALVLYVVATQAADGHVSPVFIDFGLQAVGDLRQHLRRREGSMSDLTYTEAMRFLDRAERGLTRVRRIATSPGGAYP